MTDVAAAGNFLSGPAVPTVSRAKRLVCFGLTAVVCFAGARAATTTTVEGAALRDALFREAARPAKLAWWPMRVYLAELHGRSVLPTVGYFKTAYESPGAGYFGGRAFGHWDLGGLNRRERVSIFSQEAEYATSI